MPTTTASKPHSVRSTGRHHSGHAPGLFAVRKVSSGRFLITSVSLRVPHDIDFDDPENFARSLWWRAVGRQADVSLDDRAVRGRLR